MKEPDTMLRFEQTRFQTGLVLPAAAFLRATSSGCTATAVVLGAMAVDDRVTDTDASKNADKLLGKAPAEADSASGARIRTLEDTARPESHDDLPGQG